jgi:hypothetical protein
MVAAIFSPAALRPDVEHALSRWRVFAAPRKHGPIRPEHSYPYEADFHINLPVLFFSVGLALLSGIIFGLFPALQSAEPEISQVMQAFGLLERSGKCVQILRRGSPAQLSVQLIAKGGRTCGRWHGQS